MLGKTKVPLLVLLVLVSLFLAGATFYLLEKKQAENLTLQGELENVKAKHKIAEAKLQESKQLVFDLESKLQEAESGISTLTGELEKEKSARQEALTQIEQLRADLEQQKKIKSDLETKFNQAQEDMAKIQEQVKTLESEKADLEAKVKDLEAQVKTAQGEGVELGKIVVNPESAPASSGEPQENVSVSVLEGKVLVVNKDYSFAVIDLGSNDGVNIGDTFSIYHNDKYLGDVSIEKVHDAMAATAPISGEIKDNISEGDKVVKKVK